VTYVGLKHQLTQQLLFVELRAEQRQRGSDRLPEPGAGSAVWEYFRRADRVCRSAKDLPGPVSGVVLVLIVVAVPEYE